MYRFHIKLLDEEENVLRGRLKTQALQYYEYLNSPSVKIKLVSFKIQDSLHYYILFYRMLKLSSSERLSPCSLENYSSES